MLHPNLQTSLVAGLVCPSGLAPKTCSDSVHPAKFFSWNSQIFEYMLPSVLNCAMVVAIHRLFNVGKVGSSNPELGSTDASHIPNIGVEN